MTYLNNACSSLNSAHLYTLMLLSKHINSKQQYPLVTYNNYIKGRQSNRTLFYLEKNVKKPQWSPFNNKANIYMLTMHDMPTMLHTVTYWTDYTECFILTKTYNNITTS
jgi:hypothetical protein